MAGWGDTCQAIDLSPVLSQFKNAEPANIRSGQVTPQEKAVWAGSCVADASVPSEGWTQDVYLVIDAFDTNVKAFDHYHDFSLATAEMFSDAPIDQEFSLSDESGWNESRVTAQETPTTQSAERVQAAAALLGDFYTVQILVRFKPGEAVQSGCESDGSEDCVMTATSMAEFLATSGFLEDMHTSIEAAIDSGV
jgi:hypothetical protein